MRLLATRAALLTVMAMAGAAGGCTNIDLDANAGWFTKPFDPLGRVSGFTYYEFTDAKLLRPITAADLVDPSGACPPPALPATQPPLPPAATASADNAGPVPATPTETPTLLGHGIALGMSECDVVNRAGAASAVDVRNPPGSERSAVLTYNAGPWPGIYHFRDGRLIEVERAAQPPETATPKKKPAKPAKKTNQA